MKLACFGAGGGLWTTPTDLARFGIEKSKAYKGKSRALDVGPIFSFKAADTIPNCQYFSGLSVDGLSLEIANIFLRLTCLTFRNWSNSANKPGEIKFSKKLMAQAEELGKELVTG